MTDDKKRVNHCSLGAILGVLAAFLVAFSAVAGPLEDYVQAEDLNYEWTYLSQATGTVNGLGYTAYFLDMKSQRWRTEAEVDRPLWQHWLTLIVPDGTVTNTRAMLWITDGNNGSSPPTGVWEELAKIAVDTGSVVADLRMVPNQPLHFTDDPSTPRVEDQIVSYSWDKYLTNTTDPNWIVLLPMTKAAVRAMDTVQAGCSQLGITINDFFVSGMSKRGWTTWLSAVVDDRVAAIAPMVIDLLNLQKSFRHHHAAYGYWAPAVHDYEEMGIFDRFNTPEMESLFNIIEPYEYIPVLTLPKYLVCSASDDFFLPDSSHYYFDELLGDKYLRYVPNSNHSLWGTDFFDSTLAFHDAVMHGRPLPQFSWTRVNPGRIEVQTVTTPVQVNLWQATNTTTRDFRQTTIGNSWASTPLTDTGSGLYIGQVSEPAAGWRAFFVELVYDIGSPELFKVTTETSVTPETLPFSCDLDFDGVVGLSDMASVAVYWLQTGETIADIEPPLDGDGFVGFSDFSICAEQWLIDSDAVKDTYLFDEDGNTEGWLAHNSLNLSVSGGALHCDITGSDPYMNNQPIAIDTSYYKYLHLWAKNNTSYTTMEFFWITDSNSTWDGNKHHAFTVSANDSDYKEYWVDLSGETGWNGTVTGIRIDPSGGASSGSVDYDSIALTAER